MERSRKPKTEFAKFLAEKGYTKTDLAEVTGLSYIYIRKICSGERVPAKKTAGRIAAALGIDANDIMDMIRTATNGCTKNIKRKEFED